MVFYRFLYLISAPDVKEEIKSAQKMELRPKEPHECFFFFSLCIDGA